MYRLVQLVLSAVKYLADQSLSDEEVRRRQNRTQDESADCWNAGIPGAYHEREEKTVYGQVTHLYQDYGLIDNYIYFTKEYVKQEGNLKLGDTVEVLAVRQARHTGWKAISVVPDSDSWDTIRDIYHTHGTITNINRDGEGVISHKYRFTPSCYKDYQPWRGDKVKIELLDNGTTKTVQSVKPFSTQKYTGRVVHLGQNYCFIDGDLAFTRQCCVDSYTPNRGDMVTGNMMECDQGQRWKHRALTVSKSAPKSASGAKSSNLNQAAGDKSSQSNNTINPDFVFTQGDFQFRDVELGSSATHTIFVRNGSKDILKLIRITLGDIIGSQFSISKPRISLEGQHSTKNVITSDTVSLLPGMTFYFTLSFNPRYLGVDEQTMTMEFEGLGLSRQLLGTCVPISAHSDSHPESLSSSRQKYRQVRHNINTDISQSYSVMPGVRPSFRDFGVYCEQKIKYINQVHD